MSRKTVIPVFTLHKTIFMCLLLVPFASASDDWSFKETRNDVREFVSGGTLHVRLGVGNMHITGGDSSKIRLRYTVKSHRERNVKEATVDFDVHGNHAELEFRGPGSNTQFDVELEVPQQTNLEVHDKVGDITLDGIEGDKDIELDVGDIRVTTDQSGYRTVRASTGIGDVHGASYGEADGWLGKSLHYHGEGKYEMRAHVTVGDIKLEGK
jgi:DUF4097 and DUF4098 domain-containing protein YvlB